MAFSTDTATDYLDLLDRLRTFALANGWTSLRYDINDQGGSERQLILKGTGLSGADEIFIGIDTQRNVADDWYNWRCNGLLGFNAEMTFLNQPGSLNFSAAPYLPRLHLWNDSIKYWFIANGRRIIVVAKISTVYQLGYLGWINPYLPPSAMPYPLMIAGTSTASSGERWSVADATHSFGVMQPNCAESDILANPRSSCRFWFGEWHGIQNSYNGATNSPTDWKGLWPYVQYSHFAFNKLRANFSDGSYQLAPIIPSFHYPSPQIFGELDGVYFVSGYGNAAENIITIDTVDYLVVQNVYRTGQFDYCAVRLS